jgi:hypothetical protein
MSADASDAAAEPGSSAVADDFDDIFGDTVTDVGELHVWLVQALLWLVSWCKGLVIAKFVRHGELHRCTFPSRFREKSCSLAETLLSIALTIDSIVNLTLLQQYCRQRLQPQ